MTARELIQHKLARKPSPVRDFLGKWAATMQALLDEEDLRPVTPPRKTMAVRL